MKTIDVLENKVEGSDQNTDIKIKGYECQGRAHRYYLIIPIDLISNQEIFEQIRTEILSRIL